MSFLSNDYPGALGGMSVNNAAAYSPSFNTNGNNGLAVFSLGTIAVMDLDATGNSGDGVSSIIPMAQAALASALPALVGTMIYRTTG